MSFPLIPRISKPWAFETTHHSYLSMIHFGGDDFSRIRILQCPPHFRSKISFELAPEYYFMAEKKSLAFVCLPSWEMQTFFYASDFGLIIEWSLWKRDKVYLNLFVFQFQSMWIDLLFPHHAIIRMDPPYFYEISMQRGGVIISIAQQQTVWIMKHDSPPGAQIL